MATAKKNQQPDEQPAQPVSAEMVEYEPGGAITPFGGGKQLIQFIRENVGAKGISVLDLPRIKMPSGGGLAWTIPTIEGPQAVTAIEGLVAAWTTRRMYWQDRDSKGTPPDCSSDDGETGFGWNGTDPGDGDDEVRYDTDGRPCFKHDCNTCPLGGKDAWGTAFNEKGEQTRGKACKEIAALFVRIGGELLPYVVSLPPTSLKPREQFFLRMASVGLPHYSVIMSIGLEEVKGGPQPFSRATFSIKRRLDAVELAQVAEYRPAVLSLIGSAVIDYNALAEDAGIENELPSSRRIDLDEDQSIPDSE